MSAETTAPIHLTRGLIAVVDIADYDRVMAAGRWHAYPAPGTAYGIRTLRGTSIYLQTFLTGWDRVDHRNGDGLDNRRSNLRPATRGENNRNRRMGRNNTSGFKGVSWHKQRQRWAAVITLDGRQRHLGLFDSAEVAALAYDEAARELHGEFACVNFPSLGERAAA